MNNSKQVPQTNAVVTYGPDQSPVLEMLESEHIKLLDRRQIEQDSPRFLDDVATFIIKGRATGAVLYRAKDRWALQGMLDYWYAILQRAEQIPPDATLAELDEQQVPHFRDEECPYPGFTPLAEANKNAFFGRQQVLTELISKFGREPLVAIVGPSGSGASSLVFAGLLPALSQGNEIVGSQNWHRYPTVVPGNNPLVSLARALFSDGDEEKHEPRLSAQQAVDRLQTDPNQVVQLLQATVQDKTPAILIIDQFEETFTLCAQEAIRNAFIDALVALVEQPDIPVKLILTMRAAYRGRITRVRNEKFRTHFEQGLVLITPPTDEELRAMIQGPAQAIGLLIEQEVVDELVADVRGEPSATYLLQDTLVRLWGLREYNWITLEAYRKLGGAKQALVQGAQRAYAALSRREKTVARALLLRLVQVGIDREAVSSRILRSELVKNHAYTVSEAEAVLEKLTQARVVRQSRTDSPQHIQVELMHEALVHNWDELKTWLWDDWEELRQRHRLTDSARLWEESGHSPTALLQGGYLEDAQTFTDLDSLERTYVHESLVAKQQAEQRTKRVYQIIIGALATVTLLIALLATIAWRSSQAEQQAKNVANERLISLLASEAEQAITEKPQLGLLLAVESVSLLTDIDGKVALSQPYTTLQNVLAATAGIPLRGPMGVVTDTTALAVSKDGTWVAAGTETGWVYLWNLANDELNAQIFGEGLHDRPVTMLAFDPKHDWLASGSSDGIVTLLDLTRHPVTPKRITASTLHDETVTQLAFDPQGMWLVAGTTHGAIVRADPRPPQPAWSTWLQNAEDEIIQSLTFSPDHGWLATVTLSDTLRLWQLQIDISKPISESLLLSKDKNGTVAFSPDSKWLATGNPTEAEAVLYDLEHLEEHPFRLVGTQQGVSALAFSPDNQQLAVGCGDGIVRLWNLADMKLPADAVKISIPVNTATTVENREPAAQPVSAKSISHSAELMAHSGRVLALAFFPGESNRDGTLTLATAGQDRLIHYWDMNAIASPIDTLRGHDGAVTSIFFGATPTHLVSKSDDETVRYWDRGMPRTPDDPDQLDLEWALIACQRAGRDFSPSEHELVFGRASEMSSACKELQTD